MPVIKCPDCDKSLKVSDNTIGKRVRCPGCKNPFVVPDVPVVELVEEEEEEEDDEEEEAERVTTRPKQRPQSRRPREDEEDEDDDKPRRRRRPRDEEDNGVSYSNEPLVYGILACLISCAPLIGFILGSLAIRKANAEMDRLPSGKRSRAARKQLNFAKTLGIVGICLSFVLLVVAIVLRVVSSKI